VKYDLKREIRWKEFASEGVEAACIARTMFFICSYLKTCIVLLPVAVTLHQRFMQEKFFKNEINEKIFPKNYVISERLGNMDLLSVKRYKLKNRFR